MSVFDAAPPNTHAGGNDDALRHKGTLPMNPGPDEAVNDKVDMENYTRTVPWWKRVHQHSLTQMSLSSIQATCGPAMSDAIAGLGGGGSATPQTSNITTALKYTFLASVCFFGGPLVNKIGTKWALVIGAASFPIQGSAYYCNSKFGNQWYSILSGVISGTGSGCWYVAEAGSIMSLSPSGARGKYSAMWIVSRNLGQLIGGSINLSKNYQEGVKGGVSPSTYIAFLIIECLASPFAFLISPLEHVVRSDGTRIIVSEKLSTRQELSLIKKTMVSTLVMLSGIWAIWSFFYSGTWSTYLATYFTVRARALSSLISPFFCIVGCFGSGFLLDMKQLSQRRRAQLGLVVIVLLNMGVYIWSIIMQVKFNHNDPGAIDWNDSLYPSAFLPYFFVQTTGPLSQSYMYWLISSFATDAQSNVRNGAAFRCIEAIGQAIAYGMNTGAHTSVLIGFIVTFILMAAATGPMVVLTGKTPDRIPADVSAEHSEAKIEGVPVGETDAQIGRDTQEKHA